MVKRDGVILERTLKGKGGLVGFRKNLRFKGTLVVFEKTLKFYGKTGVFQKSLLVFLKKNKKTLLCQEKANIKARNAATPRTYMKAVASWANT